MSETRKNHLTIDGGQVKEATDEHVASYKPIPESDTGNNGILITEFIKKNYSSYVSYYDNSSIFKYDWVGDWGVRP